MDRLRGRSFFQAGPTAFAAAHRRVRERTCHFAEVTTDEFTHGRSLARLFRSVTEKPRQLPGRFHSTFRRRKHEKPVPPGENLSPAGRVTGQDRVVRGPSG